MATKKIGKSLPFRTEKELNERSMTIEKIRNELVTAGISVKDLRLKKDYVNMHLDAQKQTIPKKSGVTKQIVTKKVSTKKSITTKTATKKPIIENNGVRNNSEKSQLGEAFRDAVVAGNLEQVEKLLAQDTSLVNYQDEGFTALIFAAKWGNAGMVEILLKSGVALDVQNEAGFTASDLAATKKIGNLIARYKIIRENIKTLEDLSRNRNTYLSVIPKDLIGLINNCFTNDDLDENLDLDNVLDSDDDFDLHDVLDLDDD